MAFIERTTLKPQEFTVTSYRAQTSKIDEGLSIVGNIKSPGGLHIDGEVKGAVECDSLLLGKEANLLGDVTVEEVTIKGSLTGSIKARRVILCSSCRMKGQIVYCHLAIERGAYFDGTSIIDKRVT
jgi:cytoskeletal protein CcmA (bactofilin family)